MTKQEMTYRELRKALFYVESQEMTVKELSDILYKLENQDEKIDRWELADITTGHKS